MCAIVDANAAHEVFGSNQTPASEAGKGFFRWLSSGKGKLVVGGKLKEELERVPNYRTWAQQATLSGKLINKSKDRVDQEAKKIKKNGGLQSDDPHIIALAQMSGARLLFSNNKSLHEDFRNPVIISTPRGKIYSTLENKSFTDDKKKLLNRHRCKIRD